jgi:capsular polysaccharide biosynthesis protein
VKDTRELSRLARGVQRLWWLVLGCTVVGATIGYAVSQQTTPVYTATTTLLVGETLTAESVNADDIRASQTLARTYADLARRQPVMQGVADQLQLPMPWTALRQQVGTSLASNNTQLIVITVEDPARARAVTIAKAVADRVVALSPAQRTTPTRTFLRGQIQVLERTIVQAQQQVAALQKQLTAPALTDSQRRALRGQLDAREQAVSDGQQNYARLTTLVSDGTAPTSLSVLEPAEASATPSRPNANVNTLLAATVGIMLGLAIAYLSELARPDPGRGATAYRRLDEPDADGDALSTRPTRRAPPHQANGVAVDDLVPAGERAGRPGRSRH